MSAIGAVIERQEINVVSVGEVGPQGAPGAPGASSGDASNIVSAQSGELGTLVRCTPVSLVGGLLKISNANGPAKVYAFVYDATIFGGGFGQVITGAVLTAATTEWDVVTGSSGGLVAGATYYLSGTAGRIVTLPDVGVPFVTRVGYALSSTKLRLFLDSPVTL